MNITLADFRFTNHDAVSDDWCQCFNKILEGVEHGNDDSIRELRTVIEPVYNEEWKP
jgi:hypothetical protein